MYLFLVVISFILVASLLIWFLLKKDKGEKEPVGDLWIAAGFGFGGAILAATAEHFLIKSTNITSSNINVSTLLITALSIGFIEETCKFLPLAIFLYPKKYFNEHTDGIIYFAIAGLAFGVPENIIYSLNFGAKVGLLRLVMTPIFHASTTAMVGYFLIKSKIDKKPLYETGLALLAAILIHAVYDFGLLSNLLVFNILSLMITLAMTVVFFILFMRASELDRQQALSVVGNNKFCRSCGKPNPKGLLYCEHCGQHA